MTGKMINRRQFVKHVRTLALCTVSGAAVGENTPTGYVCVIAPDRYMSRLTARLRFLYPRSVGWQFVGIPRDRRSFPEQASQVIREQDARGAIGMPLAECPDLIGAMAADGTCWVTVCSRIWQAAYSWMSGQSQPLVWGFSRDTADKSPGHLHAAALAGWLMLTGPNRDLRRVDTVGSGESEGLVTGMLFRDEGEIRFATYPQGNSLAPSIIIVRMGTQTAERFESDKCHEKSSPLLEHFSDRPLLDLIHRLYTGQTSSVDTKRWIRWERFSETAALSGIRL